MLRIFSRPWIILGLLAAAIAVIAYQLFIYGCFWWECAPKRSFSELDLDLPASFFPGGAEIHALHYVRSDTSTDPAISTNFWSGGTSVYRVHRSATEPQAVNEYAFNVKSDLFTEPLDDNDIKEYSGVLTYESEAADESNVRCGYVIDDLRCIFVARYEEFTVSFMSSIGGDGMTNENFLDIIRYIDDKMEFLLKGTNG